MRVRKGRAAEAAAVSQAPDDPDDAPDAEWRVAAEPPAPDICVPPASANAEISSLLAQFRRLPRVTQALGALGFVECMLAAVSTAAALEVRPDWSNHAMPWAAAAGAFGVGGWLLLHAAGLSEAALRTRDARALRKAAALAATGGCLGALPVLGVVLALAWRWIGGGIAARSLVVAYFLLGPALLAPVVVAAGGLVAWLRIRRAWEGLSVPPSDGRASSTPVVLQPGREPRPGGVPPQAPVEHPE